MSNTLVNASTMPVARAPSLIEKIAQRFSVEPTKMLATLKATAFRQSGEIPEPTNEQMMSLLIVADQYGLNPFTGEIFAFYDKRRGIMPIVGVDGWSRIINDHPQFDGMTFSAEMDDKVNKPVSVTCTMYRKDRKHPTVVTEYYRECKRDTGPWTSHPTRMLRHKAMIQCARLAFGFVGIYDEDEGERIIQGDATIVRSEAIDELNAEVKPKAMGPVPQTVIYAEPTAGSGGAGGTAGSGGAGGSASVHDADAPPLNLTGGPNLTDVISALRAAKTIEDVDAAEDLARHMRLDAKQREEVKAEAQGAAKRIDKP